MAIASATLASSDVALVHINSDNKIGYISQGFCELLKRAASTLTGTNIAPIITASQDHIHTDRIDWVADDIESGKFNGLTQCEFICGEGSVVNLNLEIKLLRWPGQKRPHFCIFASEAE